MNLTDELINNQKLLIKNGYYKFESILNYGIDLRSNYINILNEFKSNSYSTDIKTSYSLLKMLNINDDFNSILYNIAKSEFNYKGKASNTYIVTRLVRSGDMSESYRGHFDSHLFTLIIPVNIPIDKNNRGSGELVFFPKIRKHPKYEITNILIKIFFKLFSTKISYNLLNLYANNIENDFSDYSPLLFLGNTTFHLNKELYGKEHRVTILMHFFDPSPSFSISSFIRKLRNR